MIVVGGGYVACEFAAIMNGLGTQVIQLYRGEQILRGFDDDLRDHVADGDARPRHRARGRARRGRRSSATDDGLRGAGSTTARRTSSTRCCSPPAATRTPPGSGSRRSGVGIAANGAVEVDDWSQTAVPSIYAVGDVTDRLALTPVAIREGQAFAETVFARPAAPGRPQPGPDRGLHPARGGAVGLTEAAAAERGPVESLRDPLPADAEHARRPRRAHADEARGRRRRAAGCSACHLVGPGAAEMIQLAAIALRMGATKEDFDRDDGGASDRRRGAGHHADTGPDDVLKCRPEGSHATSGHENERRGRLNALQQQRRSLGRRRRRWRRRQEGRRPGPGAAAAAAAAAAGRAGSRRCPTSTRSCARARSS